MRVDGHYVQMMRAGNPLNAEGTGVDVSAIVRSLTLDEKRRVAAWSWTPIENLLKETGALPEYGYIMPVDRSALASYADSLVGGDRG